MECLIGTIVAAVEIGQGLKRNPDVSIYIWDEPGKGSNQVSAKLSDSLTNFFRDTKHAKVLSQFQRDENGKIGTEVEAIRKCWHANTSQYRLIGTDGAPTGWSKPARVLMCRAILTGTLRHITERRRNATQQAHIDVKLTAVLSGDG
jgi:hypothetical protein